LYLEVECTQKPYCNLGGYRLVAELVVPIKMGAKIHIYGRFRALALGI